MKKLNKRLIKVLFKSKPNSKLNQKKITILNPQKILLK
jgi:hypothetical protein